MISRLIALPILAVSLLLHWPDPAAAERITVPLDGMWSVAEGVEPDAIPSRFDHAVAVPGLTSQAQPAFLDVNQYETFEYIGTMKGRGILPQTAKCEGLGQTRQKRNYFWYARTFTAPKKTQSAVLVINKAQFGTAVWLNGKKIGEHLGCFTASRFPLADAINWNGENRLLIRIGAHPGALPDWAFYGNDGEKPVWTPGIYDSVSLSFADNPVIESVQVAPRIDKSEIVVQTRLKNLGPARSCDMTYHVKTWKGNQRVGQRVSGRVELAAGEEKLITQRVPVPEAILWSPDNPFLYVLDVSSGGDSCATRFGMREFRFDTPTRRAYLNGKIIYLRGASITLHRFFGDPLCKGQPWDEAWVRKFLVDIPKRMHWNAFRICIGPAPQQWLDIADEAGLLLQYEFPIWDDRPPFRHKLWKEDDLTAQVREFMHDNWNHPSLAIWDASNETKDWPFLRDRLIPLVRGLDLSNRPWENGYNLPQGPDDPYECHPYLFHVAPGKPSRFNISSLTLNHQILFMGAGHSAHAAIINEYDWLWLHRDGTPTVLSKEVYKSWNLTGSQSTAEDRFEQYAYTLAGLTEFWRAFRQFAGVMYLAYLDGDVPDCFTCDNFRDVDKLELEPHFVDYMEQANKPLGVYISFWQPKLVAGTQRNYSVMMVNDTNEEAQGKLELVWQREDGALEGARAEKAFVVAPLGQMTYVFDLAAPTAPGNYLLVAKAHWDRQPWSPTVARRKVAVDIGKVK